MAFKGVNSRAIWTKIISMVKPEQDYRCVWNQSAKTNAVDGACHIAEMQAEEAARKADSGKIRIY